jgi:predicted nucleic acid-binding protein
VLITTYADLPLGAVDASVVAVAERLRVRQVATLDRRHFSVVRPNCDPFELLPNEVPYSRRPD